MIKRWFLGIEYSGAAYFGWQRQLNVPSVQAVLEDALSKIADEKIITVCAGRTDARVHAIEQVVHFETRSIRSQYAWTLGVNTYLPSDIVVLWSMMVDRNLHARFSAVSRRYCYFIYNYDIRPAILSQKVTHYKKVLDINKMLQASKLLLGTNDFNTFRSAHCQSRSSLRHIYHLWIFKKCRYVIVDIKANAFLHHMVRKIIGSLIEIGCGNKSIDWMHELLVKCDRSLILNIAPPDGLYLLKIEYPKEFSIFSR